MAVSVGIRRCLILVSGALTSLVPSVYLFPAADLKVESYRHVKTLSVDGNKKGKADATWLDRKVASSVLDSGKYLPK